mmetsp:Transcript_8825/g.13977  ORF Transcript_8825/g.13977 Transcript_8825/m.13977 type:complete len:93 (-) Transcript_8825:317-595(-)
MNSATVHGRKAIPSACQLPKNKSLSHYFHGTQNPNSNPKHNRTDIQRRPKPPYSGCSGFIPLYSLRVAGSWVFSFGGVTVAYLGGSSGLTPE